jgi:hypothetical protein
MCTQNFKPKKKAKHKSFFFCFGKKSSNGDIRQNLSGDACHFGGITRLKKRLSSIIRLMFSFSLLEFFNCGNKNVWNFLEKRTLLV